MALFTLKDLSFTYPQQPKQALSAVYMVVEKGEFVVLCGRSGCGKSTLLRHLKTVLTPHGKHQGEILFDNRPLAQVDLREQSSRIGFVLQSPENQIVTDKVWHELAFGLESLGCDTATIRLRVAEMASFFGIQEWYHKDVNELSGGQKQLLNLAAVMVMQPDVLVLDEPTAQLDPIAAAEFLNQLKKINDETGTTIIIAEQRLEVVLPLADKVVVLADGKVLAQGDVSAISTRLNVTKSPMLKAFPTAARVFLAMEDQTDDACTAGSPKGEHSNREYRGDARFNGDSSIATCPITIREGRDWLMRELAATQSQPSSDQLAQPQMLSTLPPAPPSPVRAENPSDASTVVAGAKEVWFRYERKGADILRGLSLEIHQSELFCLLGGNGTGKSTTLGVLAGLLKPYRGKVWLEKQASSANTLAATDDLLQNKLAAFPSAESTAARGGLCLLPQDSQTIFTEKTIRDDLLTMFTNPKSDISLARADSIAELLEIDTLLDRHPFDVSVGEQQRAALAKVLLREPQILLLDEPTKGLDAAFKEQLAAILEKLKARGVSILMVSHDIEFCAAYADRCAMLFDGDVVSQSATRQFFVGNSFYTTAANRLSRGLVENVVTAEDIIKHLSTLNERRLQSGFPSSSNKLSGTSSVRARS